MVATHPQTLPLSQVTARTPHATIAFVCLPWLTGVSWKCSLSICQVSWWVFERKGEKRFPTDTYYRSVTNRNNLITLPLRSNSRSLTGFVYCAHVSINSGVSFTIFRPRYDSEIEKVLNEASTPRNLAWLPTKSRILSEGQAQLQRKNFSLHQQTFASLRKNIQQININCILNSNYLIQRTILCYVIDTLVRWQLLSKIK